MDLNNKKILVTGATGFIGAHVAEALIEQKAKVYCTFRKLNPKSYFVKEGLHKKVTLKKCDLDNRLQVGRLIVKEKFDFIFHLAAKLRPADFKDSFENNVVSIVNILEAAKKDKNVKGIFLASSSRSFIDNLNKATLVELALRPYDLSKTIADLIAQSYTENKSLPIVTLRYPNVFGPGDDVVKPFRLTSDIIHTLKNDKTFRPQGDGTRLLEFIFVKDVVKAFVDAAKNIAMLKYKTKNLPAPWKFSVLGWARKIKQTVKRKGRPKKHLEKAILETYNY